MRGSLGSWILLPVGLLGACASYSGVRTTPTFTPARLVEAPRPTVAGAALTLDGPPATSQRPPRLARLVGARAVNQATRQATVEPSDVAMQGAAWIIEATDEARIYRVPTRLERVTTILLPEGEQINKIAGGDVGGFLVEGSYAGARPAISILPAWPDAGTNITVSTTGGLYGFELQVYRQSWTPVVDVRRAESAALSRRFDVPVPQGQFDRLRLLAPDEEPLPAWAPVEAWADARRLVVRFRAPLPVLPGLYAGQEGEQLVSYHSLRTSDAVYLVTSRRVTEAELRLDTEVVRITGLPSDGGWPEAVTSRSGDGWRPAGPLPDQDGELARSLEPALVVQSGGP